MTAVTIINSSSLTITVCVCVQEYLCVALANLIPRLLQSLQEELACGIVKPGRGRGKN